jgi:hypothetical protein
VDETIHHYHRAAAELWKFCFARSGGTHTEFTAGLLDPTAAGTETIDWQERATPQRHQRSPAYPVRLRSRGDSEPVTDRGRASPG